MKDTMISILLIALALGTAREAHTANMCNNKSIIRMVNTERDFSGRHAGNIQICLDDQWATVCLTEGGWGLKESLVVCKELDNSNIRYGYFNDSFYNNVLYGQCYGFTCNGTEGTLLDCDRWEISNCEYGAGIYCGKEQDHFSQQEDTSSSCSMTFVRTTLALAMLMGAVLVSVVLCWNITCCKLQKSRLENTQKKYANSDDTLEIPDFTETSVSNPTASEEKDHSEASSNESSETEIQEGKVEEDFEGPKHSLLGENEFTTKGRRGKMKIRKGRARQNIFEKLQEESEDVKKSDGEKEFYKTLHKNDDEGNDPVYKVTPREEVEFLTLKSSYFSDAPIEAETTL